MKIVAIIILYNSQKYVIEELYKSLVNQIDLFVFVKNDNNPIPWLNSLPKTHLIDLKKNFGIAYAQNRGIEYCLKHGFEWVLFSDQDTIYPNNYISDILNISKEKKLKDVGAFVPCFYDEIKNKYSEIMITKTKKIFPEKHKIYKVAHAISSGTLVPENVFRKVGLMNEELFIDFVDFEWCWRLNSVGLNIYCLTDIVIHHQLGDEMIKKMGIKIVSRKLFRFYYIIRNGYYLIESGYLKGWDKLLYKLLMMKKIFEVLLLNNFSKESRKVVVLAKYNGKKSLLIPYEDIVINE